MPYDPDTQHRRSMRLSLADYARPGAYFVTLCTFGREPLFGCVEEGQIRLSDAGSLVRAMWRRLPQAFPHVGLDEFVVMPNHLHTILWLRALPELESQTAAVTADGPRGTAPDSLGAIIQSFKSVTSRRYNRMSPLGATLWQRNYHEHVVRDDADLDRIRAYIAANPENWAQDEENVRRGASAL